MKVLLSAALFTLSFSALAIDNEKYCLPFLNGEVSGQDSTAPSLMEGFKASQSKKEVAGNIVDTIDVSPADEDLLGNTKVTTYPWGEATTKDIMKYKKNGKKVVDYRMIISLDKSGNLISVAKKPVFLQDFKLTADTLYFKPQNGICLPEKYIADNKLKFSVDLCREMDRFFAENPKAKECLAARYDEKLASLVKEYAKGLEEKVKLAIEKSTPEMASVYAASHRVDCTNAGVDGILKDSELWGNFVGKRGEDKIKNSTKQQ